MANFRLTWLQGLPEGFNEVVKIHSWYFYLSFLLSRKWPVLTQELSSCAKMALRNLRSDSFSKMLQRTSKIILHNLNKSPGTYSHGADWGCMFMVWPVVWNTLISLVLKLGWGQSHTNPMNWEKEENWFPKEIPKNGKNGWGQEETITPRELLYHNTLYISLHYTHILNPNIYIIYYTPFLKDKLHSSRIMSYSRQLIPSFLA